MLHSSPMDVQTARFGVFELNLRTGDLRKAGLRVKIEGQPLELLRLLINRPGDLVTPVEIQQALWPDGTIVDFEHSIKTAVKKLRRVLGDDANNPRFVETITRRGYRFIAPVHTAPAVLSSAIENAVGQTGLSKESPFAHPRQSKTGASRFRTLPPALIGAAALALVALLLYLGAGSPPDHLQNRGSVRRVNSLAVLPLANLSGDKEEEYFADGMTEQLITILGKINNLRVISRTSSMQYKNTKKPLPQIARELNVDAVVEGAVLRSGNRIRVNAQLIQAPIERQLWAESYERDERDVLLLQNEMAFAIASGIDAKTSNEHSHITAIRPINPKAYEDYLKGRYFWNKRSEEGLSKSIACFEEAIRMDDQFAPAYSGLADAHEQLVLNDMAPPRKHMPVALNMALKALNLDPALAEAHASLAAVRLYYDWRLEDARTEFARAIELNPGYSIAHWWYGLCLLAIGDYASARKELDRAENQDPLSIPILTDSGFVLTESRLAAQGVRKVQEALELDPESAFSLVVYGFALRSAGRYQEAIAASEKAHSIAPASPLALALLGGVYATTGRRADAFRALKDLDTLSRHKYVSSYSRVLVYVALEDREQAFRWLDKAVEERSPRIAYLRFNLTFDPLRSDPRFDALRKKTGI
jgi:TolB-like protein/DNA-binding winged helix-turn-helix (wHTH) protein/Flp pilus assembly protein TadD